MAEEEPRSRVLRRTQMKDAFLPTFWTIQPADVLRQIETDGHGRVDRRKLCFVSPAYRWLKAQLRRRLPGYRGGLPWWLYCRKPDLRLHRHAWPCGERLVRLEVALPPDRVASFPCWAWDIVYCGEFLAVSKAEYRKWKAAVKPLVDEDTWPPPEPWKGRLERSWERLFMKLPDKPWPGARREFAFLPAGREAVTDVIYEADVRAVTRFQGACADPIVLNAAEWKRRQLKSRSRRQRVATDRRARQNHARTSTFQSQR